MDNHPTVGLRDADEQATTPGEDSTNGADGAVPAQDAEMAASPPGPLRRPKFRDREGSVAQATVPAVATMPQRRPKFRDREGGAAQRTPSSVSAIPDARRIRGIVAAALALLLILGVAANSLFNHFGAATPIPSTASGPTTSPAVPGLTAELGSPLTAVALVSPNSTHLIDPHEAIAGPGGLIYVTDPGAHAVVVFSTQGAYRRSITSADGALKQPVSLALGAGGHLYVLDSERGRIFDFAGPDNRFVRAIGASAILATGRGLAVDPDGTLLVANPASNSLVEYTAQGTLLKQYTTPLGAALGQINQPSAVTVASAGEIFVLDNVNVRVEEFNAALTGVAQWPAPASDTFHSAHVMAIGPRRLLVSDTRNALLTYDIGKNPAIVQRHVVSGVPTSASFVGLARLDAGHVLVVDVGSHAIWTVAVPPATQ